MVIKINPSRPTFNRKLVWENNDFSGGRNVETSQVATNPTQGSIYLNGDFSYTKFFTKRGGFLKTRLCQGTSPIEDTSSLYKKLIWVYNPLEAENQDLPNGEKIRPYQYIVVQSQAKSGTNPNKVRTMMYYNHATKTYKDVEYIPLKYNEEVNTFTYKMKMKITDINNFNNITGFTTGQSAYNKWNVNVSLNRNFDFTMAKIDLNDESNKKTLSWTFDHTKSDSENDEINIYFNKEKLCLKITPDEKRVVNQIWSLEIKDVDTPTLFKSIYPYNTSVKEEEIIGWNLNFAFWKQLEVGDQTKLKTFLNWDNSDASIGPAINILASSFYSQPNYNAFKKENNFKGLRTSSFAMMPGNKVLNTYAPDSDLRLVWIWSDNSADMLIQSATQQKQANFVRGSNEVFKQGFSDKDKSPLYLQTWIRKEIEDRNPSSGLGHLTTAKINELVSSINTGNVDYGLDQNDASKNNKFFLDVPLKQVNFKIGVYNSSFTEEGKQVKGSEFNAELGSGKWKVLTSNDEKLFYDQFVAMGPNEKAYVDSHDILDLQDSNKIFNWRNFIGTLTPGRVFFTMPQEPGYTPHNFDYIAPLDFTDDSLSTTIEFFNQLILFSKYKIFRFNGLSPSIESKQRMTLQNLNGLIGAYAPKSVQKSNNGIVFLSKAGVRQITKTFEGELNTKIIDYQVSDILSQLDAKDEQAQSCYFNSKYYLYVPSKDQIFISNIDFEKNSKGAWIIWETDLIKDADNKRLAGFYPNNNTNELLMIIDGNLYLNTREKWYDGNASGSEKHLYDTIYETNEIQLQRDFHNKKIKKVKILGYVPEKKGAKLYVDVWADGVNVLTSKVVEKKVDDNGFDYTETVDKPNLDYDAGTWQNVEGAYDESILGYDKTPVQSIRVNGKKAGNVKIRIRNRSEKEFALKALGVEFKYKASK